MAAVTGSLVVELGLNTAKLITGMKKAERRIGDFSKRAKAMAKVIAKIGAAATAAAAVGLIALAKSTANTGDQIQKMSLRLGMTTEALSELSFVAERSGVKIESLQVGLQRMTRRVSEAAAGTGEAVKALAELGVNVQDIAKMRPEDQFEAIAEALNNVKNQSDKVRLAFKLFDTEGVSLIQTMSEGAKGIRDLRDEAKKMGFSFSQDMANAAAEFNDKLTNLNFTLKGLKIQIGTALLPVMTDLLAKIQSIVQLSVDWAKANDLLIQSKINETLISMKAALEGLLTVLVPTVNFFGAVKDRIVLISQAAGLASEGMIKWTAIITANHEELKQLVREAEAVIRVNEGLGRMWVSLSKPIKKTTTDTKDLISNINIFGQKGDESFRKVQGAMAEFDGGMKRLDATTIAFGRRVAFVFSNVIYDVITRGTFDVKNLWRSMLDTMAREIARFIASRAVITFLNILSGDVAAAKKSGGGLLAGLLGGGIIGGAISLFGGGGKPATTTIAPQTTATAAIIQGSKTTGEFNKKILKKTENQVELLNSISVSSQGIAKSLGLMTDTFTSAASPFSPSGFTAFLDGISRVVLGGIEKYGAVLFGPILGPLASGLAGKGLESIDTRAMFEAQRFSEFPIININVQGSVTTETDLVQTIKDGIDILNEDVFETFPTHPDRP